MKKFMVVLNNTPGDHKLCQKMRLSDLFEALGIPFTIDTVWYFGKHKAVVSVMPHDVQKIEKLNDIETVVAM